MTGRGGEVVGELVNLPSTPPPSPTSMLLPLYRHSLTDTERKEREVRYTHQKNNCSVGN